MSALITTKNKLHQSMSHLPSLSSRSVFDIIRKSTSIQLDNCIEALSVNWSNNRSSQASTHLPPLVIRKDGSISMLLEVTGVQHLENTLAIIQSKKFLRQNLLLYLSLRYQKSVPHKESTMDKEIVIKIKSEGEKIKFIEKNWSRLGESFESGISDYFQLTRDRTVDYCLEGAEVHPAA